MADSVAAPESTRRVFLVGCPRSGTTLLQGSLGAHRDVITFTESHFYDKSFKQKALGGVKLRPVPMKFWSERFLEENEIGDAARRRAEIDKLMRSSGVDEAAAWLIDLLDGERDARGAQAWIEKTPDHVWRIPVISRAAPDAKFVHILREPQATVKSLYEASKGWGTPKSWWHFFLHWRYSFACSARYAGHRQHFLVFYEDFVRAPDVWCRKLVSWLGLAADPDLLSRRVETARRVISNNEGWKGNALQEIRPQGKTDVSSIPWSVRQAMSLSRCYSSLYRKVHAANPSPQDEVAVAAQRAECSS